MEESKQKMDKIVVPETLESNRLIIRPVAIEYAQEAFDAMTEGEINQYLAFNKPESVKNTQEFINSKVKEIEDGIDFTVYVFDKSEGKLVGGSGLHHIDTKTPEFGIWLRKSAHGNKFGKEIIGTLLQWANDNLDYEYLSYPVVVNNVASRKIPESLGFKEERYYIDKHQNGTDMELVEYRYYR